jgi:NADH-quinone oxidoreductase subunit G
MPKIVIDGREIDAKEGDTVLNAALGAGIHIPHFCYHPNLKIAGNCRMCLVELEKVPKLQVACGTQVRDGMVVTTKNERVKKARQAVLEFLLINHPLDCPVCDQCGECKLQDYCFEYGKERSRFSEDKHTFPKIDIGQKISRDQNRCIHCTRCIRYMRDVAGSEEISLTERSGHTVVGPYVPKTLESPFTLNAVDVCPVGALTSTHFRFKARTWLMDQTRTLCPGCARGCNVVAWAYKGELRRLTPAENNDVNIQWLCDAGRLSITDVSNGDRLLGAEVKGKPAEIEAALSTVEGRLREVIGKGEQDKVAILGSAHLTNEDNFAIGRLAAAVGTGRVGLIEAVRDERPFGPMVAPLPEWFIRKDKTPNAAGAREVLKSAVDAAGIVKAVEDGEVSVLLVFGADPASELEGAAESLKKLDFLMVADTQHTLTTELATVVLPEASPFEKEGTFVNEGGRLQKLTPATSPRGESRSAWQTAARLIGALGAVQRFDSAAKVFDAMAREVPALKGLSLSMLPVAGVEIHPPSAATGDAGQAEKTGSEKAD